MADERGVTANPNIDRLHEQVKHLGPWRGAVADEALDALAADLDAANKLRSDHSHLVHNAARACEQRDAAIRAKETLEREIAEDYVLSGAYHEQRLRAEQAERERDEALADRDSYDEVLGRRMSERDVWHNRADAAEARVAELEAALREFVEECGIVFADPRLDYVEIQINVGCLERGRAALAAAPADTDCVCGEINTRHCPVHANPADTEGSGRG